MNRIVVTGGTGFIGCNMVSFLKKKGHFVRAVDIEVKGREKSQGIMFNQADEVIRLDLRKIKDVQKAVDSMEYIIHLASDMGGVGYFSAHDYYPYLNNMRIDMNMLEACEKSSSFKRLFYASSFCVYPIHLQMKEGEAPKLSENMLYPANSAFSYGWEKFMMLRLCERAPFDARVGILGTIFGPFQETAGERQKAPSALVMKAIDSLKTGKFEIWGNGKQIRSFCYIEDALEKIYRILMSKTYEGPVNVASDEAVTIQQAASICCQIVGSKPKFVYSAEKPSGVISRNSNNEKFDRVYGYHNKYTTRKGFKELISFLSANQKNNYE